MLAIQSRLNRNLFFSLFLVASSVFADDHPSVNYSTNPAPSAQLHYQIKANKFGISLAGEAEVNWQLSGDKNAQHYVVTTETKSAMFGKILQADSRGSIDAFGLAPDQYDEKPANKTTMHAVFDRKTKTINFSESSNNYPIKGGEQDRTSAIWQLIAIARASPQQFTEGSSWNFFVAGRHDAEKWTFTVADNVTLSSPLGNIATIHIVKAPPPDSKGQRLDIWLAPGMEWYPVRLKFTDADGDTIDQVLDRVKNNS
jgi:hypothetical protein